MRFRWAAVISNGAPLKRIVDGASVFAASVCAIGCGTPSKLVPSRRTAMVGGSPPGVRAGRQLFLLKQRLPNASRSLYIRNALDFVLSPQHEATPLA